MITAQNLSKRFGRNQVLKGIDFTVRKGETVVLWGPNGAGKTTILRCLLGILSFSGTLHVLDFDVAKQGKQARFQIGYVPQEINLHQDQSVWETLLFYARLKKVSTDRARELLDQWEMRPAAKQRVNHLSGGMKQKLALMIALLSNPPILFLDESTNHLDVKARREFVSHLEMLKQLGKTILICSHRLSEAVKLADRIILLEEGRKVGEGTPEEMSAEDRQNENVCY
jgi:ABC-type multidrug transport system ATPase subunit